MGFTLNPKHAIRRELKRVIRKALRHACEHLQHAHETGVHEARKSVKKVRAVVALLQHVDTDGLDKDARRLRAAGHTLSMLRDADAIVATFDTLRQRCPQRLPEHTYAIMRRQLVGAKTRLIRNAKADHSLALVVDTLRGVRRSVERWRVPAIAASEDPGLLMKGYRASRSAMRRARTRPSPSALHRWRRRVKTFWYQLRVAESLAPSLRVEIRRFKQLETWLGEHHDLFVLQMTMADDVGCQRMPAQVRALAALSRTVQAGLQRKAFRLGQRLLVERPKKSARRQRRAFSLAEQRRMVTTRRRPPSADAQRNRQQSGP
jgi:hypothetical protein